MKQRRIWNWALALLTLATLTFIWSNSLEAESDSAAKSSSILELLERLFGAGWITEHLIRKLAHFAEFFALGGELALLAVLHRRRGTPAAASCLFFGLLAAVIDETLQIVSHRGSQAQDVLLDFSGVLTGVALVHLLKYLLRRFRRIPPAPASGSASGR